MRIGSRLFPYPVLNNDLLYSKYKTSSISLEYDDSTSDEYYVLNNLQLTLKNDYLEGLVKAGKAKAVCVVECVPAMFRKMYEVTPNQKQTINIPITMVFGKVSVSAYVVAAEDIPDFRSDDFADAYGTHTFEIEKGDILAADDGFTNKVDFNADDDLLKSSIFLVVKDEHITDGIANVDMLDSHIEISLPEKAWNYYDKTKRMREFQNTFFAVLAIPALTQCLMKLQKKAVDTQDSVEQLCIDYSWFNSFVEAYKKAHSAELTDEDFENMNAYEEAQKIFDSAVTKSLEDIFNFTINPNMEADDD